MTKRLMGARPRAYCFLLAAVPGAAALLASCAGDATCDDDEQLQGGLCLPVGGSGSGGSAGAGNPFECPADAEPVGEFGATCTDGVNHSDCGCPAPVCTAQDQPQGFCTQVYCDEDPSVCPAGWSCRDLSAFGPNIPHTCLPD